MTVSITLNEGAATVSDRNLVLDEEPQCVSIRIDFPSGNDSAHIPALLFIHIIKECPANPAIEPIANAPAATTKPAADLNALISGAAKDLADYQQLTAEGKLGEAGQKLEQLKQKLDELNRRQK